MQGGRRESQGTPPRKVKMFTLLLRNGVNQANVDRGKIRVTGLVPAGGWLLRMG